MIDILWPFKTPALVKVKVTSNAARHPMPPPAEADGQRRLTLRNSVRKRGAVNFCV